MERIEARDAGDAGDEQGKAVAQHRVSIRMASHGVYPRGFWLLTTGINPVARGRYFVKAMSITFAPLLIVAVKPLVVCDSYFVG